MSVLQQYDVAVQRIQEAMTRIFAARAKVQSHWVEAYRAFQFSPVKRLPAELLGLSSVGLLRVSAVCGRWREILLDTPRLWSNIAVDGKYWPHDRAKRDKLLDTLRAILEQAGTRPLALSLSHIRAIESRVMPILAEHCERWQRLVVNSADSFPIWSNVEGIFESLEQIRFANLPKYSYYNIFENAPKLAHATLVRPAECRSLPWSQLLSLTYHLIERSDITKVLSLMPQLSHPGAAFILKDPIIHRCCQAQHISSGCVGPDGRQVVQCLTLHLHTLAVTWFTTWRTKDFRSLALRSSFDRTLRVLKLTSIIMTQELLDALI
ncbi:hypothetical protein FB45DRAFT_1050865, partial [Roridomyces roridus]